MGVEVLGFRAGAAVNRPKGMFFWGFRGVGGGLAPGATAESVGSLTDQRAQADGALCSV
jgi:hypothetical protein